MTDLSGLIERVEAAQGPDREIDHAIYEALGSPVVRCASASTHGTDLVNWAPFYTASLDAAVTLMPKGAVWTVTDPANADGRRSIFGYPSRCHATVHPGPNDRDYAATPALALVAASLRALQSRKDG